MSSYFCSHSLRIYEEFLQAWGKATKWLCPASHCVFRSLSRSGRIFPLMSWTQKNLHPTPDKASQTTPSKPHTLFFLPTNTAAIRWFCLFRAGLPVFFYAMPVKIADRAAGSRVKHHAPPSALDTARPCLPDNRHYAKKKTASPRRWGKSGKTSNSVSQRTVCNRPRA